MRHRLRREAVVSVGCLTASLVHPREVFQEAVVSRAAALVLFHNHPSGDPEPSAEDLALTRRLAAAGTLMGIEVLDHLVLGAGRYVSLKERGVALSRIVYFDCASGAAGDMLLGAAVDLGLPVERLRDELARLPLSGYRLDAERVIALGPRRDAGPRRARTRADTKHRHLRHVIEILDRSTLEGAVKEKAAALFRPAGRGRGGGPRHDARARALPRGRRHRLDRRHRGGRDRAAAGSAPARFVSSPLNLGTGTVTMSHGTFAVPPPATARLVAGVPVYGAGEGELLTPTGALLVTGHATEYGPLPPLRIEKTGHGAGSRDTKGRPNVLRLIVGEEAGPGARRRASWCSRPSWTTRAPQLLGPLLERLLAVGAVDAFFTPVQMKKGRPGVLVTVLAPPERREAIEELLFRETTTLGVRRQEWDADRARARDGERSRRPTGPSGSRSAAAAQSSTMRGPSSRTASAWRPRPASR